MQDGNHEGFSYTSSGVEVETDEGRKPITQVIALYEQEDDTVRAALVRSIREAIVEAKRAREAARRVVQQRVLTV